MTWILSLALCTSICFSKSKSCSVFGVVGRGYTGAAKGVYVKFRVADRNKHEKGRRVEVAESRGM